MPFKTCGPNELMVVSGACTGGKPIFVTGGRRYVHACFQKVQKLSLNVMTLVVESHKIFTKQGVTITVTGVAQVQLASDNEKMRSAACENFIGKSEDAIRSLILESLEGHQRAIIGTMSVEEIIYNRQKFSENVFEQASADLAQLGICVISYTLKDISDEGGYLHALGMRRTAQVKKNARIGEAEATRDKEISKAKSEEARLTAELSNKIEMDKAQRDYELKQAAYDIEVKMKQVESKLAYNLQMAIANQGVKEEAMTVKLVERDRQIELQELEIERQERKLNATVKQPAEAERYRMEKAAEADRLCKIKEAEAKAEAVRLRGEAEAFRTTQIATAERENMEKRAEAWKEYQGAAKLEMILGALPKLAAEISNPLANCEKITMVSNGDSAQLGAHKLTDEVLKIMTTIPDVLQKLTGFDINQKMGIKNA